MIEAVEDPVVVLVGDDVRDAVVVLVGDAVLVLRGFNVIEAVDTEEYVTLLVEVEERETDSESCNISNIKKSERIIRIPL